jgi:transcriptional regulator with XRE-family HTH domain
VKNVGYQETLARIIKESGLTLREIAEKCREIGIKIDSSYLSKLQTGKQAPASDEINIAIAKICGVDADLLVYEKYMEKVPPYIRDFIKKTLEDVRNVMVSVYTKLAPSNMHSLIKDQVKNISDTELIKEALKVGIVKLPINDTEIEVSSTALAEIEITDDSMEPRIPKGSKLHFQVPLYLEPGDIIVAEIEEGNYMIRRYIPLDEKIVLISENIKYKPQIFLKDQIKIVGKVKSITTEL